MDDTKPAATSRYTEIGEGCFLDTHTLHRAEDGSYYTLEWTPTLNAKRLTQEKCIALADGCALLAGGWTAPLPHELFGLVDHNLREPASSAPDTKSDWYWTKKDLASSSDYAWLVLFNSGNVTYASRDSSGFVRACRRVQIARANIASVRP